MYSQKTRTMPKPQFGVFTLAEHRERMVRARRALVAEGYDGAICIGAELLNYLGGFECCSCFSPQALVFSARGDDDPILLVRNIDVISEFSALATLCATGTRTPGMHSTPMNKKIEDGDVGHMEFAGVLNRYHAVSMFTFAVGEPSPLVRELYELGNETHAAAMAECAPGKSIGGMEAASLEPLKRAGRESAYMAMFGTGLGIGYPPIWVGSLTINRWSDKILAPGMVFYAHSCLQFVDEGIGITQGGSYLVTEDGYEAICGPGRTPLFVART